MGGSLTEFTFDAGAGASVPMTGGRLEGGGPTKRCGRCNHSKTYSDGVTLFPFHLLVRQLIPKDFKGKHFGMHSFLQTLEVVDQE